MEQAEVIIDNRSINKNDIYNVNSGSARNGQIEENQSEEESEDMMNSDDDDEEEWGEGS